MDAESMTEYQIWSKLLVEHDWAVLPGCNINLSLSMSVWEDIAFYGCSNLDCFYFQHCRQTCTWEI